MNFPVHVGLNYHDYACCALKIDRAIHWRPAQSYQCPLRRWLDSRLLENQVRDLGQSNHIRYTQWRLALSTGVIPGHSLHSITLIRPEFLSPSFAFREPPLYIQMRHCKKKNTAIYEYENELLRPLANLLACRFLTVTIFFKSTLVLANFISHAIAYVSSTIYWNTNHKVPFPSVCPRGLRTSEWINRCLLICNRVVNFLDQLEAHLMLEYKTLHVCISWYSDLVVKRQIITPSN